MVTILKYIVGTAVILLLLYACFNSGKSVIHGIARRVKKRKSSGESASGGDHSSDVPEKEVDKK